MTIYKVVIAPTNIGGTHDVEFSANTYSNTHLVYLVNLSAITYSGCSTYHPFLTGTGGTYSLLSCGPLSSSTSTIGNYVIDWRLNSVSGSIILTSGNLGNMDPAIESYHPFSGVPVPGGTLYPVIRYVYINGFKYVSVYDGSARFSPDLINCLNPILIENINCGNGTLVGQAYTHIISYTFGGTSSGASTRTLYFDLNTDGTTKYFAWDFNGVDVPDTMKISYSGSSNSVLSYWTVGSQATTNYTTTPKVYGSYQELKSIIPLTGITYVSGDKLKIEVTPNVNANTNWSLKMRCMTGATINCANFPIGVNVINPASISMTYLTGSTCTYRVNYSVMSGNTLFNNSDFNKYFSTQNRNNYIGALSETTLTIPLSAAMTGYTIYSALGPGSCVQQNSTVNISQSSNVITLTFQDITDYNAYKNGYYYLTGTSYMNNYTSTDTSINHYKKIILYALSGVSCGDVQTSYYAYFHMSSPVVFDDINKIITITMTNVSNGFLPLSGVTCNDAYAEANQTINYIPLSNSNINSNIRNSNPFGGWFMDGPVNTSLETTKTGIYFYFVHPSVINNSCSMPAPWCLFSGGTGDSFLDFYAGYYIMIKSRVKVDITNPADPLNNYTVSNGVDYNTGQPIAFYQIYP